MKVARRARALKDQERFAKRFRSTEFKSGDMVHAYRPRGVKGSIAKLWMGWSGPFKVLAKRESGYTYEIERAGKNKQNAICHVSNLIKDVEDDRGPAKPVEYEDEPDYLKDLDEELGEREMQEARQEMEGVLGGESEGVREERKKKTEERKKKKEDVSTLDLAPVRGLEGKFKLEDFEIGDFIIIQTKVTRFLLRVAGKNDKFIKAQFWRRRGNRFFEVWTDTKQDKEDWTNRRPVPDHCIPSNHDI